MKSILFLIALSTQTFAWGPIGHRTVGEIAEKSLSPAALKKLAPILNGQSFAKLSTWPDEIKSEPDKYKYTFKWHYTEWKNEDETYHENPENGTLISAIKDNLEKLKSPKSSLDEKRFALSFVIHLVGDLHMPLHVGNGLDRGGNWCSVFFHDDRTNLHSLWDEGMIDFQNLSFSELVRFVSENKKLSTLDLKPGQILEWAKESKLVRETLYPKGYDQKVYCQQTVSDDKIPRLAFPYSYEFLPVVEERLYLAGKRLALLLE